jgi:hypothetical protein
MRDPAEIDFLLVTQSSNQSVYRHWRDWKTKQIIETIAGKNEVTADYWDKAFEAVVLFHHPVGQIVFCDSMSEALQLHPRYRGCEVVRLSDYLKLATLYGGENTHGPDAWRTWKPDLTLMDLLGENEVLRSKLDFTLLQ